MSECPPPFFGREGTAQPSQEQLLRRTDAEVPAIGGRSPKSVFQIGGAGQVGTGSIRGMPILRQLSEQGFHIWPFDAPTSEQRPLVVEIYPRLLTGSVVKKSAEGRRALLERYAARIRPVLRDVAAEGEDQLDAAVSAAVMNRYLNELVGLDGGDEIDKLEGRIWHPKDPAFGPGERLPDFLDPGIPDEPFALRYLDVGITDGPFRPELTQVMPWGDDGPDGTVGLATAGVPLYLRVLERDGDRLYTADGEWIQLIPEKLL